MHVAELRLWLQLVIETEHQWYELKAEPMLPNLSFKLRPGDSLVQEVGGVNFGLHNKHQDIPASLKGKLTHLKAEKLKFYRNDPQAKFKNEGALKQEELNIFREILDYRVEKLEDDIKTLTRRIETPQAQAVMPGMEPKAIQAPLAVQQWKEERTKLEEELKEVRTAREALRTTHDIPFVWDIAFVEIFRGEKEGFDIVIGNPPYVRQEKIEDPQKVYDKGTYKAKLQQSAYAAYPAFFGYNGAKNTVARKIDGKSDYYVFFYLHGLKLLNEKGSFCFITSNSWLDVGYGRDLQEFLLKHCHIKMILDNEKKRSFAQADINTVIALFSAPNTKSQTALEKQARFILFRVPFEHILSPVIFDEIEEAGKSIVCNAQRHLKVPVFGTGEMITLVEVSRLEFRVRLISQNELYKDGLASPAEEEKRKLVSACASYEGGKWGGKFLRAPEVFWTILEKGKGKLVRLKDIAGVRRGFTTGANNFFYLELTGKPAPKGLLHVKNGAGWEGLIEAEFLKLVVKSPRDVKTIRICPSDLRDLVFTCHLSKDQLRRQGKTHALAYIQWGEGQKSKGHQEKQKAGISLPELQSFTGRALWFALAVKQPCDFLCNRFFNDRLFFAFPETPSVEDQTFYGGWFQEGIRKELQLGIMNSTLEALFASLLGRVALGEGVLQYAVFEMEQILLLSENVLTPSHGKLLKKAFERIAGREIKSIFEELGLPKPNKEFSNINSRDISLDKILPDRRELDKVVFETLGLTEAEQLEVYRAVVELVKNRLVKAGSV